jgi:hypothetical protein
MFILKRELWIVQFHYRLISISSISCTKHKPSLRMRATSSRIHLCIRTFN